MDQLKDETIAIERQTNICVIGKNGPSAILAARQGKDHAERYSGLTSCLRKNEPADQISESEVSHRDLAKSAAAATDPNDCVFFRTLKVNPPMRFG